MSDAGLWFLVFTLVVVAPVTEEPLFRGLLLRGFLAHRSRWKAVLISSLLFGAFHIHPRQVLPAIVIGGVFAWWRIETGSVLPALIGHALYNLTAVVFLFLINAGIEFGIILPLWLNAAGVVLTLLGVWSLRRLFQNPLDGEPYDAPEIPPPK